MFSITKDFEFSASHRLIGLAPDHQCGRLHGHNYRVRVELVAPDLNDVGFVYDYGNLKPFKTLIDRFYDHQHLNDVFGGDLNPTAEIIAEQLWLALSAMLPFVPAPGSGMGVSETPKTWAWYRP